MGVRYELSVDLRGGLGRGSHPVPETDDLRGQLREEAFLWVARLCALVGRLCAPGVNLQPRRCAGAPYRQ